jgi:hypothetical protein
MNTSSNDEGHNSKLKPVKKQIALLTLHSVSDTINQPLI